VDGKGAVSYTWKRNGIQIATGSTYILTLNDVGKQITATASYSDGFTLESATSDPTTTVIYVNSPVTGDVTISGTPAQYQVLTADTSGLSDIDGLGAFSYQWIRGTETILGATASTYTLTQTEVGKVIYVNVSYIDLQGTTESKTSAATATVVDANDLPTGDVTISGIALQGSTLTASNTLDDTDGMGTVSYRWYFNGVSKFGAVGPTYTLLEADVGKIVTVTASYTDLTGVAESKTSAATAAVENVNDPLVGRVSINGTAQQGQQLAVNISGISDLDGRGAYSYRWMRDGTVVGTVSGYILTQADVGKQITLFVSYTDLHGTYESSTSLPTLVVANVNDSPTGVILYIDGNPKQNELLTATIIGTLSDADGLGELSYKWMRNGLQIDSATNSTYRLVHADVGKQITVSMSYTDGFGKLETILSNTATTTVINANDSPTGTVTISGIAAQYQILTASNAIVDLDGMGTVSYRWKRNGLQIAAGTSYTLTWADVGSTITVTAVYTDLLGTYEGVGITSAPTAVVVHVNTSVTGDVTISRTSPVTGEVTTSGTPKENELLTAITDGLSDVDGLGPFSYQWKSDGIDILNATDSTYTLTQAMVGKTISVTVSYTDIRGNAESKTSAATAPVINMNDLPVGEVTISGILQEGELLTASNYLQDADGLGTVSYQWKRGATVIATGSTYTLTQDDVSQYITVVASYTDLQGTAESASVTTNNVITTTNNPVTGSIIINGIAQQGQQLTYSSTLQDIDGIDSIEYFWIGPNDIELGRNTSYTLTQSDVGSTIKVYAVCKDMQGRTVLRQSDETAIVSNVNDLPVGTVTITGTPTQNQLLTANTNGISDLDGLTYIFTYQWTSDGINISGATDATYLLVESDVGKQIHVTVQYTDQFGALETVTSDPTAAVANVNDPLIGGVTITGTATQGELLTASNTLVDIDGLGEVYYQWKRGATVISGVTGSTYTLVQADVGYAITVVACYMDGHGTVESATSDATAVVANVNDFPVGSPIITGIQTQGQVLTADTSGISDLDGLGAFSYQWRRKLQGDGQSYVSILGATSATYTLTQDDVSNYIMVVVSYTDGYGRPEIRVSADTAIIANVNDLPAGSVTISGTPTQNQVLTVSHTLVDIDGLGPITYQWKSGGVDISGATGSTYTLVEGDVGKQITVTASYTDLQGTAESKTSAATAIVANVNDPLIGDVTISGTPTQGELLTASNTFTDADGMGTVSYQWKRGGVAISGATGSTYTLVQADVNSAITVLASYTDGHGTAESKPSNLIASVANVNDLPTGSVTISGTPTENQILTAITSGLSDLDGLGAFSYQWIRGGVAISGATSSTYTLVQADVGSVITVTASYTDLQGTPESKTSAATASVANVNDLPTGSVTISGTPEQNQVLTASNTLGDLDGLGPITYQWKRAGTAISGATGSTYTLVQADVGKYITVTASYTDIQGAAESKTSAATVSIANVNDPLTGSVTIAGTATQGQLLTASNTLADADGMGPITYQWKRGGVAISGATGSGYILVQADVNSAITVTAYYTDLLSGAAESATSAATGAVANVNDLPTGSVTISGTPTQNQVLTASNTLVDIDGLGPITYQWKRGGAAISGATSATYTLIQADVGSAITVTASYIDLQGAAESKTSAATAAVANVNDSPTGSVTIAGTPTQNQILTVSNTLVDVDGLGPITYQWKRGGVAISGATGQTYTLVQADVNSAITVTASYTDLQGIPESATSAATATVTNVNDPVAGEVTISGTPTENQVLTAITSGLSDLDGLGAFSYQWMRAGSNISGATASTYTLIQADVGQAISVKVSYTDLQGTPESKTSAATATVVNVNDLPTGSVTISGTPTQNQVLTASNTLSDLDGLGPITYQWKRGGAAISGATSATYTLIQVDVGSAITVTASYTDIQGAAESKTSAATAAVANVNDSPTGSVTIAGTPTENQILTVSNTLGDLDGLGPITYQWKRGGVAISGATGSTYTLVQADVNSAITVTASYTDLQGIPESVTSAATTAVANVNDPLTGDVTISGTPTENQVLTAITSGLSDLDGLGAFSYQWIRAESNISGATASTYTLVQADVGQAISVKVSYTDLQGTPESKTSAATAIVTNVNDLPTGSVTIAGTPTQNQILTVSNTLGDVDGLGPITYQWKRGGVAISGATGSTYTLVQADVNSAITVTASYTDLQGTPESKTSAATAAVANVNDSPTGSVTIAGTPTQNQILTVSNTLGDVDGLGPITYQWKRGGVAISGATGSTYTLVQSDVDSAITVTASYTDLQGTPESVTSAATALVANVNDSPTGAVTITGTPTQNQVLTASNTLIDIDGLGPITYQWKRNGVQIASGTTYTLVQADVGSAITVTASYTDIQGTPESVTSAATAAVANVNDSPTGSVTIAGTPAQYQVLTVSHTLGDVDGMGPITYQWKSGGDAISGATGTSYALTQTEVGKIITVTASYTDLHGFPESVTSAATATVVNVNDPLTGDVTISGTPTQNQVLTAITSGLSDLDGLGAFSYQWMRAGSNISGATGSTYTLVQVDVGQEIAVKVSYTDLQGTPESKTSAATALVVNVNDLPTGDVTISGTPTQNQVLTASNTLVDIDGLGPITYQWKRDAIAISGATSATYTLMQVDVGSAITVTASYTDLQGIPESKTSAATAAVANVNDSPSGSVTIAGTPTQNQILTASNTLGDIDGLGPITYQWNSNGSAISGATGSTYTLVQADVNSSITVTASYTDLQGAAESKTSAATALVANVNDSPTGAVTISGTPTQYQVLTVSNTLVDIDGLGPITYQWKRTGSNISGATGSTYTLTQSDVGSVITVTASYTDVFGAAESKTSAATTAVANVNDSPTGSVTISGTPTQNQILTASNTLADIDGLGPITYQWKRNGVQIASGTTYTLVQADVNKSITVTASYTDIQGTNESITSAATALIANVNDPLVGHVMIDGDLTQGQTLTASNSFSDVDGLGAVSYQWLDGGEIISGAVGSTYTLTPVDIGAKISVVASYTDSYGAQEQKTSAETYPIQPIRGYSLQTKGIESVQPTPPVNGKVVIANTSEFAITTSNNATAFSEMTSVEKQAFVKHNVSALLAKYAPSSGSDKLYVSKSLLPFTATSPLTDIVELIDAKSSSIASPLVHVGDASTRAVYIDTAPGSSVTLRYLPDTVTVTHTSGTAFSVIINGAAAVNKSIGDKILLKRVVLTLGSITAEPNNLPVFVQNAPTTVFEDASYSYTVSVSDADNDTFTVTAPILPSWLTFTQATGTLSCPSVPSAVVGNHAVQLLAEDIWGGTTYYDFTITVQNVPVTGTVTSSASLKYSDLNTVQTPILKAVQVSESDATVVINNATVNGVDVRSYLQLGVGPSNYAVTVKSGQHAALLTLLRSNPGNVSVAIKITDISTPASPIYVIETITVLNDSPTTTQQFPSSMTIIEDSATAYAQSGGADSTITFSEACSVVLNGTYKDYFTLVATDGTSRTYKLKCKDLASARAIIPGTSYSLTVTATSSASALTVTSTSLSVQATNILTTATVGGAKILTHASLQAYITSSAVIPNIATITLSESDPQSITLQTVTVNGSSVDKTYFTVSGSAGNYVLNVNTSAASQLLTRLSALITSSSAYNMLMTFQVVEQGGNAFTQPITVAASNNIIKVSLKSTVTNVPSMVSYSVTGSVATVVMNYSATPVIDYVDYIISDANSAVGTRAVGGGIAYDGAILPTMYVGVSLVKSMVYQSPGEWIVTYYESYSGITGSQSNSLTLKFSVRGAINFVLPALNASYELLQALSIIGDYTAPAPFALPTITLSMPASQFNDGLFQLALTDSNINTLVNPASEAVYFSEKITYYANESKFPLLKNSGNMLLKDLPVVNGTALKPLRQRNAGVDRLSDSMIHELAYQLIGVSLMDDQIANGATLKASIDDYLTTALPAFVRSQLANCNGKTQNIAGASDLTTRANVSRELFMQIVESVVGGVNPATGSAKSSRLNSLFADSNLAGGKYGIKFIAGDTLRFSITIAPYSVGGVVQDVDYIVDGVQHAKQEARTVELVITMV
jgi:hypothetical protein